MKLPDQPAKGQPVLPFGRDVVTWMRANTITSVEGGKLRRTPGGTVLDVTQPEPSRVKPYHPPFKLSLGTDPDGYYIWRVSSKRSTVIDGTNGAKFDLSAAGVDWSLSAIKFDVDTLIEATKDIVLSATIDPDTLEPSDWTLAAVDYAAAQEVILDAGPPITQTNVNLLIGTIYIEETELFAEQAITTAQCLGHGFYNGLVVRSFAAAPTRRTEPV